KEEKDKKGKRWVYLKCQRGHEFVKPYRNLHDLKACPSCKPKSIIEETVRQILAFIFNRPFYSFRPHWLKLDKMRVPLEIDCYCEDRIKDTQGNNIKLGIEVDGEQHSVYKKKYYKTEKRFFQQQKRDR